ncbi:MAG: hypothetical protein WCO11_08200 [Sphingomonadales bacterium]|jgi:hypothetical protein
MASWTQEKVVALETDRLANLRENAMRLNSAEVVAWCDAELAKRKVRGFRGGRAQRPDEERNAEAEAVAILTAFAKSLLAKYDLSAETAKRLSRDVKGFRALDLLGKNGVAKVGGLQLNGSLGVDRYISYRLRNDKASLDYVLMKGRPIEEARWIAVGPKRLIPDAELIVEQMQSLRNVPKAFVGDVGTVTDSFSAASEMFAKMVGEIAAGS